LNFELARTWKKSSERRAYNEVKLKFFSQHPGLQLEREAEEAFVKIFAFKKCEF